MQQNPKESKSVLKANSKQVNNTISEYNKYQNIDEIKKKSRVFPINPFFCCCYLASDEKKILHEVFKCSGVPSTKKLFETLTSVLKYNLFRSQLDNRLGVSPPKPNSKWLININNIKEREEPSCKNTNPFIAQ